MVQPGSNASALGFSAPEMFDLVFPPPRRRGAGMVVGAGVGTTATHVLAMALGAAGLRTVHGDLVYDGVGPDGVVTRMSRKDLGRAGLRFEEGIYAAMLEKRFYLLDNFDAVVDSPVSQHFPLLATLFPEARFVLSVRHPVEWAASRIPHHEAQLVGPAENVKASRYGACDARRLPRLMEDTFALYNLLVTCLVPPDRLWIVNAWEETEESYRAMIEDVTGSKLPPEFRVPGFDAPESGRRRRRRRRRV